MLFRSTQVLQWDENYRPKYWEEEQLTTNVMDPNRSIYAEALKKMIYKTSKLSPQATLPNEMVKVTAEDGYSVTLNPNEKYNQYKYGRPDVIFRTR